MVRLGNLALKHKLEGNVRRTVTPPPMLHKVDTFLNDELHLYCSYNTNHSKMSWSTSARLWPTLIFLA